MGEVHKKVTPYKRGDLFIYISVFIMVAALFLLFVVFPNGNKDGVIIRKHGKDSIKILFDTKKYQFLNGGEEFISVAEEETGVFVFTVYDQKNKSEYNVVKVDCVKKTAKVTESNCSLSKDCVYSPPVENGKGAIICDPHELLIIPISNAYSPVVIG